MSNVGAYNRFIIGGEAMTIKKHLISLPNLSNCSGLQKAVSSHMRVTDNYCIIPLLKMRVKWQIEPYMTRRFDTVFKTGTE